MSRKRQLEMRISLNALEHLGMNLYSNVPAVLSEIVANAWDADARLVEVTIDKDSGTITIQDNGMGMNRDEVIDRFLTVGFKRRKEIGGTTPLGRKPMGRKGIGKLSTFSISQIVDVHTVRAGEQTSFRMDRDIIKEAISGQEQKPYLPEELKEWPSDLKKGTRIILSGLSKALTTITANGLKRRVARRFSIIGSKHDFSVMVNGSEIDAKDRGYNNYLEYVWTYGSQSTFVSSCKNLSRDSESRTKIIVSALKPSKIKVTGWLGTVSSPSQLKDEEGDNLNRIAIFMRGKMAQEDVLDDFGMKEIYANYLIGELHCEELDVDEQTDIATSSRQALKQDDSRFENVRNIVLSELRYIAGKWSDWRVSDGTKSAQSVPAVSNWLQNLQGDTKKKAERWVGRLNTIRSERDDDKKELLKASILAFESYRRKEELDHLEKIKDESVSDILAIFKNIDDLELSYYGQIVKLRIGIIKTLQRKLKENEKEHALRDYIFNHLWLLDSSWERAKGSEHSETTINKYLKTNTNKLNGKEKNARIDIGYRTAMGKHVIIELKRASVAVPLDDLTKQIRKYRDGARKLLDRSDNSNWQLEIICLVGKPPPEWDNTTGPKGVKDALANVDARIVFYNQLLDNAQSSYADYLVEHVKADKLWGIFDAIDDFAPP